VLNGKSQDSIAKHLGCDELLHYKFIIQFAGEKKFKIGEHLPKLQAKTQAWQKAVADYCWVYGVIHFTSPAG